MSDDKDQEVTYNKLVLAYKQLKTKYTSLKKRYLDSENKCSLLEFDLEKYKNEVELLNVKLSGS